MLRAMSRKRSLSGTAAVLFSKAIKRRALDGLILRLKVPLGLCSPSPTAPSPLVSRPQHHHGRLRSLLDDPPRGLGRRSPVAFGALRRAPCSSCCWYRSSVEPED
jgi:hypothetical protein